MHVAIDTSAGNLGDPLWFDALLRPHRSLSRLGFRRLMLFVIGVSAIAGLRFWVLGAWPVALFFLLDAALIWGAFKLNYWAGYRHERVKLSREGLEVAYVAPNGRVQRAVLEPYFAQVQVQDPDSHHAQVRLSSRGQQAIVGSFLTREERLEVAAALKDALHRFRNNLPPVSVVDQAPAP